MGVKYQIIVEINADGELILTTSKGFRGPSCYDELKLIADSMGPIHKVKKLQQYYETEEKSKGQLRKKITSKAK